MNFNNPDDVYSSSPLSADNQSPGGAEDSDSVSGDDDDILAEAQHALDSEDSSQSSAKLDAALRQAATQAGTQRLDLEDDGDMTMDIAEDEVTASFKPWAKRTTIAEPNQENIAPSSPASSLSDGGDDMSMDITRAVGRIVPREDAQSSDVDDDMSMELTMPLGSIKTTDTKAQANRRKSLKRRVSMLDASQGSPAKRPASRRTSLRHRPQPEEVGDDATMDLTMAIGGIKNNAVLEPSRRVSVDTVVDDATMDFTLAVGSIKSG